MNSFFMVDDEWWTSVPDDNQGTLVSNGYSQNTWFLIKFTLTILYFITQTDIVNMFIFTLG